MSSLLDTVALIKDPYFDPEYAALYLEGNSSLFHFRYEEEERFFSTLSIKRPIDSVADVTIDEEIYDLETPYGYGGYLANTTDTDFLRKALDAYTRHCEEEKIVAEFIRFHPFNTSIRSFFDFFDFCIDDRPTIYIDTTLTTQSRHQTYSSKVRRKIRKCERELSFFQTEDLSTFKALYHDTMRRNRAADFYRFDDRFFDSLFSKPFSRLYAVSDDEEIVSMVLVLLGPDIMHIHLSANRSEKMHKNGNYLLFDRVCDEAREAGCRYSFVGGGRSNRPDDTLLRFKRQFSSLSLPFYIAGKIFDQKTYRDLLNIHENIFPDLKSTPYFLKYRLTGGEGI